MSSLYNLDPPPTAKVLLNTTSGDLVFELFAKQTPLASRNFVQHCLDGYYDGTIFHRLVPGFIIQGGDPTGLGTGGISAINNGAPFQDEFHSRLKFNRRGLLGMANSGQPDDNTSQFFVTLDATPELQAKNTMFGRIEGDTIYNLMKMVDADLADDGSDRPLYPTRVISSEVLLNPFDDMVKRVHTAVSAIPDSSVPVKKKRKPGKNLLSFAADDPEDAAPPLPKKAKVNPNFLPPPSDSTNLDTTPPRPKKAKVNPDFLPPPSDPVHLDATSDKTQTKSSPENVANTVPPSHSPISSPPPVSRAPPSQSGKDLKQSSDRRPPSPPRQEENNISKLDKVNQQIAELKASMKRSNAPTHATKEVKKSALESMIPPTSTRGRKRGKVTDEKGAMNLFKSFKERLETMPTADPNVDAHKAADSNPGAEQEAATKSALDAEETLCDLHFIANCQSCHAWDKDGHVEDDEEAGSEWMAHTLSFAKDTLGKDLEWRRKMEEFEVVDPRAKAKDIQDRKRDKVKPGGRDWDKQRDATRTKTKM